MCVISGCMANGGHADTRLCAMHYEEAIERAAAEFASKKARTAMKTAQASPAYQARAALGLTRKQAALDAGVNPAAVTTAESNPAALPTSARVKLAALYGIEDFLPAADSKPSEPQRREARALKLAQAVWQAGSLTTAEAHTAAGASPRTYARAAALAAERNWIVRGSRTVTPGTVPPPDSL
jgi:hypothetical protein